MRETREQLLERISHTKHAGKVSVPLNPARNRPEVIAAYKAMPYCEYLLTDWWKKIKTAAIRRAGFRCRNCHCGHKPLDVHHITYERLGNELDADVQALCRDCHSLLHQ